MAALTDSKKRVAYPEAVRGYKKFLGRKPHDWFAPPHGNWCPGPLVVNINPEVGLERDGTRIVGKLYFKDEPLSKRRAEVVAHLISRVLAPRLDKPAAFAVIDVRRGRTFQPSVPQPAWDALLVGEAASFAAIFEAL